MLIFRHVFLLVSYTALAVGVVVSLPYSTLPISFEAACGIGALIFLIGIALHEGVARRWADEHLRIQLHSLASAGHIHSQDIAELTSQIAYLRSHLEELSQQDGFEHMEDEPEEADELQPMLNPQLLKLKEEVSTAGELAGQILRASPLPEPAMAAPVARGRSALTAGALRADPSFTNRPAPDPTEVSEAEIVALVREAVAEDRVQVVTQPIVNLPQRKTCFREQFTRLRLPNGEDLEARHYVELAEREGFITSIDNFQLFRSAQIARDGLRRRRVEPVFVNLSSYTLRDRQFITKFVEFLSLNAELAGRVIFEFSVDDLDELASNLRSPLDYLAQRGFRYSLDGVTDLGALNIRKLSARHFRFLKIPASEFLRQADPDLGAIEFNDFRRQLDSAAMDLIVSHIETQDTLLRVLDFPVDYGQGHLFGEPA